MLQALSLAVTRERKSRVGEVHGVGDSGTGNGGDFSGDAENKGAEVGGGDAADAGAGAAAMPTMDGSGAAADRPGAEDATEWDIMVSKEDVEQACRLQVRTRAG